MADNRTRHVFVKHGCPRRQQSQTMAKISKSYILTPPHHQGHVMSVKCEQPLDELTVQVWLLYDHQNFKYCTLILSGTELRTDRRTDKQTDGQTDGRTDDPNTRCPRRTFQAGGIKTCYNARCMYMLMISTVGKHMHIQSSCLQTATFPSHVKSVCSLQSFLQILLVAINRGKYHDSPDDHFRPKFTTQWGTKPNYSGSFHQLQRFLCC